MNLPYDEMRGVVPNVDGRVVDSVGQVIVGTYVTGWIKRGAKGVIGTNKQCALQTVDCLIADLEAQEEIKLNTEKETWATSDIGSKLSANDIRLIETADWKKIDRQERVAGRVKGRPRIKFTDIQLMQGCL